MSKTHYSSNAWIGVEFIAPGIFSLIYGIFLLTFGFYKCIMPILMMLLRGRWLSLEITSGIPQGLELRKTV